MINILENTSTSVSPLVESRDSGWEISDVYAIHSPCNAGTLRSVGNTGLEIGKAYVVTYTVDNYISGGVKVILGTTEGLLHSEAGTFTETIICGTNGQVSFYSNGSLRISQLVIYEESEGTANYITIAFYEGEGNDKKFVTNYSMNPDLMIKFLNRFFMIKDGQLWEQNVNEVRNNFFGIQYQSKIQFYANINPTTVKVFYSTRVQATTVWFCPNDGDISILPTKGRSVGMSSRIKRNNFKNYQGSFFADFMRNSLDPRFDNNEVALFKGEPLRGRFMAITIINDDTTESVLYEIDVKSAPSAFTY